jgi:archaetidylinositol phosphate synthase
MLSDQIRKSFSGLTDGAGKLIGSFGISANFVTFLVLVTGIIAAYYIYIGAFYLAILFVLISGVLDGLDGAVAKAMKKETKFGGLFDSTTDKLTEILIYISLGLYNPVLWLPASLAISFFMLSSYISKHAKASGGKSQGGLLERKERIILIVLGLFFIHYMNVVLWIIATASLFTGLQRFAKNYKILSQT